MEFNVRGGRYNPGMRKTILAAALLVATSAAAATVAGVKVDDKITVNSQGLVLNGAALRKKFVVKVYVGSLYLPAKQTSAASILAADTPRRQVMHFLYDVDKEKMVEAWTEGLRDNTPNASPEVKTAFTTLSSWMEDMK